MNHENNALCVASSITALLILTVFLVISSRYRYLVSFHEHTTTEVDIVHNV